MLADWTMLSWWGWTGFVVAVEELMPLIGSFKEPTAGKRKALCKLLTEQGATGNWLGVTRIRDCDRCLFKSANVQATPDTDRDAGTAGNTGDTLGVLVFIVTDTWMSILLSRSVEAVTIGDTPTSTTTHGNKRKQTKQNKTKANKSKEEEKKRGSKCKCKHDAIQNKISNIECFTSSLPPSPLPPPQIKTKTKLTKQNMPGVSLQHLWIQSKNPQKQIKRKSGRSPLNG